MTDDLKKSLARYVNDHILPGSFLTAVLENNLFEAVCRADRDNFMDLRSIVIYVDDNVPCKARGSRVAVREWVDTERWFATSETAAPAKQATAEPATVSA